MAYPTRVGTGTGSSTNAASVVCSLHGSTAIGDVVLIAVVFKRAGGSHSDPLFPAGFGVIAALPGFRLYEQKYTATPPATVTISFTDSDVHALAFSISLRDYYENAGSAWRHIAQFQETSAASPYPLGEIATQHDETLLLTLYASFGAAITKPTEQTSLHATTSTSPNLGIAAAYQEVATVSVVPAQDVTLAATTSLVVVRLSVVPAAAVDAYAPLWDTPIGPFSAGAGAGQIIFDPSADLAYHITKNDVSGDIEIRKIVRSTFTLSSTTTLVGYTLHLYNAVAQDATHLYLAQNESPFSYVKVQKSDLAVIDVGDAGTNVTQGPTSLQFGVASTWSAGLLWGLCYASSETLQNRLVGWNPATGGVSHNIGIPETTIGGFVQFGWTHLTADSNGDLWILGMVDAADFPYTGTLTKVTSGPTINAAIPLLDIFPNDDIDNSSLTYDPATHALIITTSSVQIESSQWSQIARYDIAGAVLTYVKNYGGMYSGGSSALHVEGNGLRDFGGTPSIFIGWFDGNFDWFPATITQYNHVTGALIRTFEMQGGYDNPDNIVLSPEGCVWMTSGECLAEQYIHRVCFGARGELSWIEMEMPPAASGNHWLRPTYGRGYGKGYGDSHG